MTILIREIVIVSRIWHISRDGVPLDSCASLDAAFAAAARNARPGEPFEVQHDGAPYDARKEPTA